MEVALRIGVHELLTAMISLVALRHVSSVVVVCWLSCPKACGTFLDQGSDTCPLHCQQVLNHWAPKESPRYNLLLVSDQDDFLFPSHYIFGCSEEKQIFTNVWLKQYLLLSPSLCGWESRHGVGAGPPQGPMRL